MNRFRTAYKREPQHLLWAIALFAFVGYVVSQIFDGIYPWSVVVWFVLAIGLHDLLLFPLYTGLDRIAPRGTGKGRRPADIPVINHVRVPAILAGVLFVVWFPLILRLSDSRYERATGQSENIYLGRWLLITGALFAASAAIYAVRRWASRKQ